MRNYFSILRSQFLISSGQSLIEILVALSITLILLSVSTVTIVTALNNAQHTKNRNLSSHYAEQGLEIVRQMRDSDWQTFSALSGSYCLAETCTRVSSSGGNCGRKVTSSCGANVDTFSREVRIERNIAACNLGGNSNNLRATVTVAWSDGQCASNNDYCRQVSQTACYANLYSDPSL